CVAPLAALGGFEDVPARPSSRRRAAYLTGPPTRWPWSGRRGCS
ncbi:MAG: hypothetical protein AVDCRST_MAG22-2842, partial [uncultured Rubrobacteraceae bacterium]